jgi:alanyl aminopeptidase
MATFIEQPGLPLIALDVQESGKVKLTQRRFHNYGITVDDQIWQVPVGLKYSVKGETQTRMVLLNEASKTVDLGAEVDWILPNLDANGYYRWNVSSQMLESMSSGSAENLTARERIGFLSNVGALLQAGAVGGDDYLRCLAEFAGDREPLVLATMLDALDGVNLCRNPGRRLPEGSVIRGSGPGRRGPPIGCPRRGRGHVRELQAQGGDHRDSFRAAPFPGLAGILP